MKKAFDKVFLEGLIDDNYDDKVVEIVEDDYVGSSKLEIWEMIFKTLADGLFWHFKYNRETTGKWGIDPLAEYGNECELVKVSDKVKTVRVWEAV